jgi:hypothetical protein
MVVGLDHEVTGSAGHDPRLLGRSRASDLGHELGHDFAELVEVGLVDEGIRAASKCVVA